MSGRSSWVFCLRGIRSYAKFRQGSLGLRIVVVSLALLMTALLICYCAISDGDSAAAADAVELGPDGFSALWTQATSP
ncbi:hypothetical protein [Bifidobacterium aquikefiri]|uniref:hypothetical protein n=1 Tax=Bifidobacterium aquikefiri TaxID=1653207 RepID=UPI0023F47537|nr:hypothetical protein [Bifidobacterium aquikefiri]